MPIESQEESISSLKRLPIDGIVIPAEAGIQSFQTHLDPGFRRGDGKPASPTGGYAREALSHLWLVEPLAKTLEVYRLENGRWVVASTYAGSEHVRAEPFDAVALDLSRWWLDG